MEGHHLVKRFLLMLAVCASAYAGDCRREAFDDCRREAFDDCRDDDGWESLHRQNELDRLRREMRESEERIREAIADAALQQRPAFDPAIAEWFKQPAPVYTREDFEREMEEREIMAGRWAR
jgi:hypothetical protein